MEKMTSTEISIIYQALDNKLHDLKIGRINAEMNKDFQLKEILANKIIEINRIKDKLFSKEL